jgi:hypothetical protein
MVQLEKNKVSGFTLGDTRFSHLETMEIAGFPGEGFYEVLYGGGLKVFVQRKKKVVPADSDIYRFQFSSTSHIYIYSNNAFHQIRSKREVRNLFIDRKKEVRLFAKEYRHELQELEDYVIVISRYYDSLKKAE